MYRRRLVAGGFAKLIEKLNQLIKLTGLLYRPVIRAAKTIGISVHTYAQIARESISSYGLRNIRAHLQDGLWTVRVYQFPRAIRVAASVSLMIIVTLSLLVISEDRQPP